VQQVLFYVITDQVGCATSKTCEEACGSSVGCTNYAYAKLVLFIMPVGAKGKSTNCCWLHAIACAFSCYSLCIFMTRVFSNITW